MVGRQAALGVAEVYLLRSVTSLVLVFYLGRNPIAVGENCVVVNEEIGRHKHVVDTAVGECIAVIIIKSSVLGITQTGCGIAVAELA